MRVSFDDFGADAWFRDGGHERGRHASRRTARTRPDLGGRSCPATVTPTSPAAAKPSRQDDSEDEEPEGDPS